MREPIEKGRRQLLVAAEDLYPLAEGEIGRHDDAPSLVAFGQQVEEQLATGAIERNEAELVELVEHEELDALQSFLKTTELACVARFKQ